MSKIKTLLILCAAILIAVSAHANAAGNKGLAQISLPDPNRFIEAVPVPVRDLLNSAKQIGEEVARKSATLSLESVQPLKVAGSLYDKVDGWFFDTTGLHIKELFRGILNLVVGVLTILLDILKWVLSLVR